MGSFDVALKPFRYWVDGAAPRSFLTRPDTVCRLSSAGRKMLDKQISNHLLTAEMTTILQYLSDYGAKEIADIASHFNIPLETACNYIFSLSENGLVTGNRFYDLYNTKNPVNLKPVLPKEMAYG